MKATGIVRKVDQLGRIVLPVELRKTLNIKIKEPLEIYVYDEEIFLKKYKPVCIFCGNEEKLIEYKFKRFCENCKKSMIE